MRVVALREDDEPQDSGPVVRSIQEMLNALGFYVEMEDETPRFQPLDVDGIFGKLTEAAVIDFQESEGLLADGKVGPLTMRALEQAYSRNAVERVSPGADSLDSTAERHVFVRAPADKYGEGYDKVALRDDVAAAYERVYDKVAAAGGLMTSSGGRRALTASVNPSRSAVSMHYLGRALDLFIFSGMVDPTSDPYVVVRESERRYRVYARCSKDNNENAALPERITVQHAIRYDGNREEGEPIEDHLLDLTGLFKEEGFEPIRARPRFEKGGSIYGAEWWHFQYEKGLIPNNTTFGQELLRVYRRETLEGTPPWRHRDNIFKVNWS